MHNIQIDRIIHGELKKGSPPLGDPELNKQAPIPSYSTNPEAYLGMIVSFKLLHKEVYEKFRNYIWEREYEHGAGCMDCCSTIYGLPDCMLNPETGSRAIAEFLEEMK